MPRNRCAAERMRRTLRPAGVRRRLSLPGKGPLLYCAALWHQPRFAGVFCMAEQGSMDITQHRQTYAGVMALIKWSLIAIIIVMALMGLFLT